ncbi:hypothetical protein BVC93_07540 [Mycobacterium sp. MS1601]|uniref:DUF2530 domain-containing protein n=1 Tax=Mycobacterium sp. MS1601 TaxID=1936029 RepID=UPI0009790DBD|nr:DUF2530 domain-containing protein [Mycobacterium sp. MS1601]AQA02307.1 hypothetical protein BVC93_07540 [Mycobacterium sp. MS1601]
MTSEQRAAAQPPPLPPGLLEPWRVIAVGAAAWVVVTVLSFTISALHEWRPISIAGLATGVVGTLIFLWQRSAAQRGARGAQTGLTIRDNRT